MSYKKSLLEKAQGWIPKEDDSFGIDKKNFLLYLTRNCIGRSHAISIRKILENVSFSKEYTRESFQHHILVPLKEEKDFFIGTCSKGLYFISDGQDAFKTITFYTNRIRAERKHLRNLKKIVKRNKLFKSLDVDVERSKKIKKFIYLDESGVPSLKNKKQNPYFIVGALVVDGKNPQKQLAPKLDLIRQLLGKERDYEFKSTRLKINDYFIFLRELSTIDYEFAAICFIKDKLKGEGFNHPKSFYKYAYGFLLDYVLDEIGEVNLCFDEYGGINSKFQDEFFKYIERKSVIYPIQKIQAEMFESKYNPFIQITDVLIGTVKKKLKGNDQLMAEIEEKVIDIRYFPFL